MGGEHGSRFVPIVTGIVEFAIGFFIAGIGRGAAYFISLVIGGGLCLMGLRALYIGIFAKQEKIDEMTLKNRRGRG